MSVGSAFTPPLSGAQILVQLAPVQGNGSGLDADLLRGANHVTAPTPGAQSLFQGISQPGQLFPAASAAGRLASHLLAR